MENKGCKTCKHEHRDTKDYPCSKCSHSYIDKYEPKTNADMIRNMSDEELAEWIHNMCEFEKDEEPYRSIYNLDTEKEEEIHDSDGDLLKWLQSEAEQERI